MPKSFKRFLEDIACEKTPGPATTFTLFHMLRAIELIAQKSVGRNTLASNLNIGEGAVRTIINRLKDAELIAISRTGCFLTKKGLKLLEEYQSMVRKVEIGRNELSNADFTLATLIKQQSRYVSSGMKQRDAAVMAGARNATTVVLKNRLLIPSVSNNFVKDFPKAAKQIMRLKPEEGDVIIIVGAESSDKAEYGALAAAWTLIDPAEA